MAWIVMLTRLRATGMPIREVRTYAALVREGDGNERKRLQLLLSHREKVLADLEEVRSHLAAIDTKIELYESRLSRPQRRSA